MALALVTAAIAVPEKIDRQELGDQIIKLEGAFSGGGVHHTRIDDTDLVGAFQDACATLSGLTVTGLPTFGGKVDINDLEGLIIQAITAVNTKNGH
jgi:hypothetical protein